MDRITALERLARLHASGGLSDSEYEAEKQRILTGAELQHSFSPWARPILAGTGLLACAGAIGWLLAPTPPEPQPNRPVAEPKISSAVPEPSARPEPQLRELSPETQRALAFRAVYGDRASATIRSDGETYLVHPASLEWLGDKRAALLTLAKIPNACHGCPGAIGVHYVTTKGQGFEVDESWPLLVPGSSWGEPAAEWSIRRDLSEYPVIASKGAQMGQGYTCEWTSLAELRPEGAVLLGTFSTGFSDEGARSDGEPVTNWVGRIKSVATGQAFEVEVNGSEYFMERYVRRGGKFVPAQPSQFTDKCG